MLRSRKLRHFSLLVLSTPGQEPQFFWRSRHQITLSGSRGKYLASRSKIWKRRDLTALLIFPSFRFLFLSLFLAYLARFPFQRDKFFFTMLGSGINKRVNVKSSAKEKEKMIFMMSLSEDSLSFSFSLGRFNATKILLWQLRG